MAAGEQLQSNTATKRRRKRSTISSTAFDVEAQELIEKWEELSNDINAFKNSHEIYLTHLEEIEKLKKDHRIQFNKIETKIKNLNESIDVHQSLIIVPDEQQLNTPTKDKSELLRIRRDSERKKETPEERIVRLSTIREHLIKQRSDYLKRIKYTLPQPPERYLRIILGSELPVSILDKSTQWKYKESYEEFKLRVTLIIMVISLLMSTIIPTYRALDAVFHFLLVWYYCTLTIRESILVVNGSKIQFWWRLHHFISTICTCILLIWPSTKSYKIFRQQHYIFSLYISCVQVLLYYYQRGLLYRLRALGESDELQISIEGFQSWMLRGLSFLAPFLFIGYLFELYNAYVLYNLSIDSNAEPNPDWQFILKILSAIFFILFLGNFFTMYMVIRRKISERIHDIQWLQHRYESVKTLVKRIQSVNPFHK
ncbi:unnamed protein product [Adineta steineri]|uniref:Transmembrane protein 120-like protein n=1 Tax=Adineta steineri TaxID=433720 RepID=A0A818VUT2_9BILA|nr:unnamed protein product [Adineta steineri]CAF3716107.1 unnamed protein product [Adineta steineri]